MQDHIIICGYGATGQSAARDLLSRGVDPSSIVVVDSDAIAIEEGTRHGFVGVVGDATRTEILHQAGIREAKTIIVSPNRDDTAVLITLTARELNTSAHITAGGREQENLHLLHQGGANEVVDATAAIGRMLGLGAHDPAAAQVLDDLLDAGEGIELVEVVATESGALPPDASLVAIVRHGERLPQGKCLPQEIREGDRIVVLRDTDRPAG